MRSHAPVASTGFGRAPLYDGWICSASGVHDRAEQRDDRVRRLHAEVRGHLRAGARLAGRIEQIAAHRARGVAGEPEAGVAADPELVAEAIANSPTPKPASSVDDSVAVMEFVQPGPVLGAPIVLPHESDATVKRSPTPATHGLVSSSQ